MVVRMLPMYGMKSAEERQHRKGQRERDPEDRHDHELADRPEERDRAGPDHVATQDPDRPTSSFIHFAATPPSEAGGCERPEP